PDFAYVGGLLRDIGRLALLVKYPESYANLLAVTGEHSFDLVATERELFDIDHCEAGGGVVGKKPFPPELWGVVAHHHEMPDGPFRLVHLVRVADLLADALGFAALARANQPRFDEVVLELPPMARSRFATDPDELAADIQSRIESWS